MAQKHSIFHAIPNYTSCSCLNVPTICISGTSELLAAELRMQTHYKRAMGMSTEILENEIVMARLSCAKPGTPPTCTSTTAQLPVLPLDMFDTVAHNLQPNDADMGSNRRPGKSSI